VVGLSEDDLGARVHTIVQLDGDVPDDDLRAHVRARLTCNKVPSTFERVDHPLRDDTGQGPAIGAAGRSPPSARCQPRRGACRRFGERAVGFPDGTP
jgi:hypothetical protein